MLVLVKAHLLALVTVLRFGSVRVVPCPREHLLRLTIKYLGCSWIFCVLSAAKGSGPIVVHLCFREIVICSCSLTLITKFICADTECFVRKAGRMTSSWMQIIEQASRIRRRVSSHYSQRYCFCFGAGLSLSWCGGRLSGRIVRPCSSFFVNLQNINYRKLTAFFNGNAWW